MSRRLTIACIAATAAVSTAATLAAAQGAPAPPAATPAVKPPFSVSGFRYHVGPGPTHYHVCEADACVAGSRVSYVLFAPSPNPSFEDFIEERSRLEQRLEGRLPPGITSTFEPPEQTRDPLFTIFKAWRTDTKGAASLYVLSQRLHSPRMTIELISSGPDRQSVNDNATAFLLPMMMATASQQPYRGRR